MGKSKRVSWRWRAEDKEKLGKKQTNGSFYLGSPSVVLSLHTHEYAYLSLQCLNVDGPGDDLGK